MFKKTWTVVSNSSNPDMQMYFGIKLNAFFDKCYFFSQMSIARKLHCGVSSFSKKNGLSAWIILDFIYSFFLAIFLRLKGSRYVLFDNAHINNIPLSFFTKILGCKQIFTIHDWEPHPGSNQFVTKLYNYLVKRYLADEFIVYSPVNSNKTVHCFYLGGFPVVPNTAHSGYFLFYGRIEPYKGLNYLLPIADELLKRNPSLSIVVAGKGEDESLEKLSLKENVRVINKFIEQRDLDELISGAIAILMPYESASQSGVIPQVAAFGKSIVAHDVGALGYYINDRLPLGTLVNKGDILGFVQAMLSKYRNYEILTTEVRYGYSQLSRDSYIEQFGSLFND